MLGAIIGDIIGSHYEVAEIIAMKNSSDKKRSYEERIKILDPNTPLFTSECSYTDDSVLTLAIASSLISPVSFTDSLKSYGNDEISLGVDKFGRSRFGKGFVSWIKGENSGDSYGNGASMRISPVAFFYDDLNIILTKTKEATIPSHNHPEAINGAEAISTAIYLSKNNYSKAEIKAYIEKNFGYSLDFDLEYLQRNYRFSSRTQDSIPQAIFCFLESNNFEDCLRKSISIGGDTDTIAAIACSIAESFYGVPDHLKERALSYLSPSYQNLITEFYSLLKLKKILIDLNICHDRFWEYMSSRTKRVNFPLNSYIWGTFTDQLDADGKPSIRILVPYLNSEAALCINIHEYAHAYEFYNLLEIGADFATIDVNSSEEFAKSKEAEYKLKKSF